MAMNEEMVQQLMTTAEGWRLRPNRWIVCWEGWMRSRKR
jgi:hypothetical protein